MFWDSVQGGLKVLTYWETYLAAVVYQFITYYLPMIVAVARERTKKISQYVDNFFIFVGAIRLMRKVGVVPDEAGFGSLGVYFIWLLEAIATLIFIVMLAPIILGLGGAASWSAPWRMLTTEPGFFFFLFCILIMQIVVIILSMLPYLGRIYSLQIFVFGCTSVMLILSNPDYVNPDLVKDGLAEKNVDFYPFLYLISFYISGVVIFYVGIALSISLISLIQTIVFNGMTNKSAFEDILLLSFFMPVLQFIPVFMYGACIGNQMYF